MRLNSILQIGLLATLVLAYGCGNKIKFETTKNGLEHHFFKTDEKGKKGEVKDIYSLNVTIQNDQGETLLKDFWMFERYTPVYPGDFHEGLALVGVGDSVVFKLNADSFFYHHNLPKPKTITQKNSVIRVFLGVENIQTPYEHFISMSERELKQMNAFVERKRWDVEQDTTGILYEIVVHNPDGKKIEIGDQVLTSHLYYTLNEQIMNKSKDGDYWKFTVGDMTRISGLSRILTFMRSGEKLRAILPFSEAYGAEGFDGPGFQIAPYTTIVIEIQVHDIAKKAIQ